MVESGESANGDGDEGGVRKPRAARAEDEKKALLGAHKSDGVEPSCVLQLGLQRLGSDVRVDPSALVQANRKA